MLADTSLDITVGMPVTKSGNGLSYVQATSANLTAGKSGIVEGVATTVAGGGKFFIGQVAGVLDPSFVPGVGPGAVEFAVNVNGTIGRSPVFSADVIGAAGKDGSVALCLGAGIIGGGGGGGIIPAQGVFAAICTTTAAAGDVVTVDAIDPTKVQKATAAALLVGQDGYGILLGPSVVPGSPVLYVGTDGVAPNSVTVLNGGEPSYVVVVNARPVRKRSPEANDYIIGFAHTTGAVHVRKSKVQSSAIVVGSPGYECIADGSPSNDCWPAIQRALDDAIVGGIELGGSVREVLLPRGNYFVSHPLHLKQAGIWFHGEGPDTSVITNTTFAGPGLLMSALLVPMPTVSDGPIPGQPLGLHVETFANELDDRFIDLTDYGTGAEMNGLAAFTVRMLVKVPSTGPAGDGAIMGSFGQRFSFDFGASTSGANGWAILVNPATRGMTLKLTTATGGLHTGALAPVAGWTGIPLDVPFWIEVVVSGGLMRIFCEDKTTNFMKKLHFFTAVGNTVQMNWESTQLGTGFAGYFGEGSNFRSFTGNIYHLQMSSTAYHTFDGLADYTDAFASYGTTRPGIDGFTFLYNDFQTYQGVFVGGKTSYAPGSNAMANAWYPVTSRGPTEGPIKSIVSDLGFYNPYGPCIVAYTIINGRISNIRGTGKSGIVMRNNCYNSYIYDCTFFGANSPRYGVCTGAASYQAYVGNVQAQGFKYGILSLSSNTIVGGYYIVNTEFQILLIDNQNVSVTGASLSDEGGGFVNPLNGIGLLRAGVGLISGCSILTGAGTGNCFVSNNSSFFFQKTDIDLTGTQLGSHPAFPDQVPHVPGLPNLANYQFKVVNDDGFVTSVNSTTYQFNLNDSHVIPGVPSPAIDPTSSNTVLWNLGPIATFESLPIVMTDANRTITADEAIRGHFVFTGTLTANRTITMPNNRSLIKTFYNNTGGGFSLIIKTAAGASTPTIPNGQIWGIRSDGAEMRHIQ